MNVEFIVNGGVTCLLSPENEMEEQLLKQLAKQTNEITEVRGSIVVFNQTLRNGLVIGKKSVAVSIQKPEQKEKDNPGDEDKKETV